MRLAISHRWDLGIEEAQALQARLAGRVICETTFDPSTVATVAGVDVGLQGDMARAAVVVLWFPSLEPADSAVAQVPIRFPYVPGLLSFREGPPVLSALDRLHLWPDLFLFDAHGLAHPRRFGLAAHLGVLLDAPSIGCAKSRLVGAYQEPGPAPGDWAPLLDERRPQETIGAVVRTRTGVKPVFVSVGHRVDLDTAIRFVLACTTRYRLPQTTRYAHQAAGGAEPAVMRRGSSGRPGVRMRQAEPGAALHTWRGV
jgi:deoxyribonuclease V